MPPASYSGTVRRLLALVVAGAVAAFVLWPALAYPDGDSFPQSPYRMFATDRGRVAHLATAVGVGDDGEIRRLSPRLINGTFEVVQASAVVSAAIRRGAADQLCREVATRIGGQGREDLARVEVVTETHDAVAFFAGERDPSARAVHARCPVPDGPEPPA